MTSDSDNIKNNQLRKRAEKRLKRTFGLLKDVTLEKAKILLHELEVHQIELEMQNEELSEAHHRLEELHDQYIDLFDFAPVGYLVLDRKGIIVNINLTACDLLGIERALIKGKPLSAYMPSKTSRTLFIKLQEAFETGELPEFELQMKHKCQALFTASLKGSVISNNDQNNMLRLSFQDVTKVREAKDVLMRHEALQKEKEKLQQYLDYAPVVFLLLDTDNNVQMINQKGCDLVGTDANNIIEKKWINGFIYDIDNNNVEEQILNYENELASLPSNFESKLRNTTTGDFFIMSWTNVPLLDNEGSLLGTLMAGENITERKSLELRKEEYTKDLEDIVEERTRKLTEALHNEKMVNEMKTAFVSMASHEFRTPLTSIFSSAILLKKYHNLKQHDNQVRHIERIKSSVNQLTNILEDFLSMDKLERGIIKTKKNSFKIEGFIQDVIKDIEWSLKENQHIHYNHKGNSMIVMDEKILHNIFLNLITNAIKYSDSDIVITSDVKDDIVDIMIIDKGIGIPKEEQKHLFTKFFRAKNVVNIQGTGLGLTIVKHYVNLLGGEISFESQLGKGSKFYIKIPQNN